LWLPALEDVLEGGQFDLDEGRLAVEFGVVESASCSCRRTEAGAKPGELGPIWSAGPGVALDLVYRSGRV